MALTRSENMSRIKGKNTKPEGMLRRVLWARGARYRLHYRISGVRPDIAFLGKRVAIFVDGCQWHGCPDHYVRPRTNNDFWSQKLRVNVERDQRQTAMLEGIGWRVLRFWEHDIHQDLDAVVGQIIQSFSGFAAEVAGCDWRVVSVETVDPAIDLEERTMVDLRHMDLRCAERRIRSTRKWKRRSN